MELDDIDADGPPLLVEANKQQDNDVDERLGVDVDDINLVKVPITIVTGRGSFNRKEAIVSDQLKTCRLPGFREDHTDELYIE